MYRCQPTLHKSYVVVAATLALSCLHPRAGLAQGSAAMGDGLGAAAIGRGGSTVTQQGSPVDAIQGNPAGLSALHERTIDLSGVLVVASGDFRNAYNADAKLGGLAGALPYGAFASGLGRSRWVGAVAITPEILMKAHWRYNDTPGTAGVTYGLQTQETQIIGVRSSIGLARPLAKHVDVGATLGVVYNQNTLNAPYIFQQQPVLRGLKARVALTTRGYGWNGSAGVQWQAARSLRVGVSWKSGTTIHTEGDLKGSASALFTALGVDAPSDLSYRAQVLNHLPQAFAGGAKWQTSSHLTWVGEAGMTGWGQAFQQLPITLTGGTNVTVNSLVGSNAVRDAVPLHWKNQLNLHAGLEYPASERITLRGGYSFRSNPVPSATLTPLTAAIMRHGFATGLGWGSGRWQTDVAYQIQLPSSQSVGTSGLQAGEYDHSTVRVLTQSATISFRRTFKR